jgi:hypothetical protein
MSSNDESQAALSHERAQALLPWLINGTLGAEERAAVEAHTRSCLLCRAELSEQRALRDLVRASPTFALSPEQGFARLRDSLDSGRGSVAAKARWRRFAAPVAIAATVSFATLAALWLAGPHGRGPGEPRYATVADQGTTTDLRIDVVFAADVSEQQMRDMLAGLGATIVAGPSEIGRYTLELGRDAGGGDLDSVLAELRRDPRVRLAARTYTAAEDGER